MLALITAVALAFAPGNPSAVIFDRSPGWHVGATAARRCIGVPAGRCTEARSWASTVPFEDCAECLPRKTLAKLAPDGVVIQVTRTLERPPVARRAPVWPPTVRSSQIGSLEGVPPRIGVYQRFVRVGDSEITMFVFFGRAHPSAAQLEAANDKLSSSRLA